MRELRHESGYHALLDRDFLCPGFEDHMSINGFHRLCVFEVHFDLPRGVFCFCHFNENARRLHVAAQRAEIAFVLGRTDECFGGVTCDGVS